MNANNYNKKQLENEDLLFSHISKMTEFWQKNHDLEPDGKCGPSTRATLEALELFDTQPILSLNAEGFEIDAEGWLRGENAILMPAHRSWYGPELTTGEPIAVVNHYTATDFGTAKTMHKKRLKKRKKNQRAASWHVTIDHKGKIWQSVPFTWRSWHCAKGLIYDLRVSFCTVGIELEGYGKEFTDAQISAYRDLALVLRDTYRITCENFKHGHVDFDPARRSDPGPLWTKEILPKILKDVFV